jgi:uncharacterized membrane protein HdeD (DUF308 family)
MSTSSNEQPRLQAAVSRTLHEHWLLFLIEGIVLVLIGLAAVAIPVLASLTFTLVLGWLFLFSGLVGLITTFWARQAPGFWWSLLSALLAIVVGGAFIAWPIQGVGALTLTLVVFFVIEGVASIMYAFDHRRHLTGRWGFVLAAGICDLFLAAMVVAGLPGTAMWAIGLLVGINMVFGGTSLIAMALAARSEAL